MDPILDSFKKLQFTANKSLLSKAQGLYAAALGKHNTAALPLVCIHLACNCCNIPAPVSLILNNLPIAKDKYVARYHEVSQFLNIPPPSINLEELGVVYGCQMIVSAAIELKSLYHQKCQACLNNAEFKRIVFDSMDMNVAIFESVAKALKTKLTPQPNHSALSLFNVKTVKNLRMDIAEKCKSELKEYAIKFKKTPLKDKTKNSVSDHINVITRDATKHKLYSGLYALSMDQDPLKSVQYGEYKKWKENFLDRNLVS